MEESIVGKNADFVEEYRLVIGKKYSKSFVAFGVGQGTDASIGHVNFDYELVYEYEDNKRWDVIGFWHSHPPYSFGTPSSIDVSTMHGWTNCLDRPLLCAIDYNGRTNGWWFKPSDEEQTSFNRYKFDSVGKLPILKIMNFFWGYVL